MSTSRSRHRQPLAALLAVAVAVGLLGACTREAKGPPKISTVGVLKAAELGTGTWTGPYASFDDAHIKNRMTTCPEWNTLMMPAFLRPPLARNLVVWVNGDMAVESFAYLFDANSSSPDDITRSAENTAYCADQLPTTGNLIGYSFTVDHVDGAILLREKNRWEGTDWIIETALRRIGQTIVTIDVSYTVGTVDPPVALDLLAKAVTDSAELAKIATPAAGSGTPSP
jgi:hypothetical protein